MRNATVLTVLAAIGTSILWVLFALYVMSVDCDPAPIKGGSPTCSSFLSWKTQAADLMKLLKGLGVIVIVLWIAAFLLGRRGR